MEVVPIRAEVIEARRSRKAGAIVLARPVPMKVAAGCGAAVTLALGLLLGFGEYTSKVRAPKFNQYMIDEVLLSADRTLRDVLALGLLLLLLVQSALSQMRSWTIMYLTTHLNLQWVSDVFSRLVRLPMNWFEKRQLGDVLSRFGSVGPIHDLLTTRAIAAVLDGLMAVATLTMMILYSPLLAAVVVGTVVLYALVRAVSYRPLREANVEAMALAAKEQTCLMETIRAIGPIKMFGRELDRRARWMVMKVDTVNRNVRTQVMGLWSCPYT